MNKLLIAILAALALGGCGDSNQKKLEACMDKAERKFFYMRDLADNQLGCTKPVVNSGGRYSPDTATLCAESESSSKRTRLEDENRCVKLYK